MFSYSCQGDWQIKDCCNAKDGAFVAIVNDFQLLTTTTESFILGDTAVLDPRL